MARIRKVLALIFVSAFAVFPAVAAPADGLVFSITEWDTGPIEPDIITERTVEVLNDTEETVTVDLISTCSCISVEPEQLEIAPGESGSFIILFDSSDDRGEFEKLLIIRSDSPSMPKGFFVVAGSVNAGSPDPQASDAGGGDSVFAAEGESPELLYYYTPGCKSCNRFLENAKIPVIKKDITEARYYEELQNLLAEREVPLKEVPVMVTAADVFQGEASVIAGYNALLEGRPVSGETSGGQGRNLHGAGTVEVNISLLPVMAAGLLDGVNPCAFTTLIFLLSALSVAGRSRRETLITGLFFTLSVFVTYYMIGLGFFRIIRIADSFNLVSRIIRWLLFGVLLVFAVLSFYDYGRIRSGRSSEILLQLPDGIKKRMHSSIRSYSKSAALAGSSIVMGFFISIFELGCTGQIYFPTITYIIQTQNDASGYLFLGLYNLAFILPLVIVFTVVFIGITSKRITKMFQSNMGLIKILTGLLFIAFAVLMIVL